MPLYRTVSDRGLWKKYHKENVQHFHKPHYLEKEKDKPQVDEPICCSLTKGEVSSSPHS